MRYGPASALRAVSEAIERGLGRVLVCALSACLLVLVLTASALGAEAAPHVVEEDRDTDACAMCHRSHSSASDTQYRSLAAVNTTGWALMVGVPTPLGDAGLCFVCHGPERLGSSMDVLTAFSAESSHSLRPDVSEYGPQEKQCSSCHDSHGYERRGDGSTYPALLRSQRITATAGALVFEGDEYCAACHLPRADERWDGFDVFQQTAHYAEMAPPATGTGIRCVACHDAHGSDSPPLIVDQVLPPASAATVTVPANDRRLCFACHTASLDAYGGKIAYDVSSHALSSAGTTIPGSWASVDATRPVGECQVCHAPMGRDDGSGGVIPELRERAGRALCDFCHGPDGPASADVSSTAYPVSAFGDLEILVSIVPSGPVAYDERLAVYSRETTGAGTRTMVGPREYRPDVGMGDIAIGDVDGDGDNEVVLADPSQAVVDTWAFDGLRGLADGTGAGSFSIAAPADLVAVADVILDGSGRPEIAVVNAAAGELRLYRYDSGSLTLVDGPLSVGAAPSSLASGDVTGTVAEDLVVTAAGDDRFRVLTESAGSLSVSGPFVTRSTPRGASVGDVWAGGTKDEIVIVNAGETSDTVSVFRGDGTVRGHVADGAPSGAAPYASVVADVLPGTTPAGTSGMEVSVVYRNASSSGTSTVDVFAQLTSGGLDTPLAYDIGVDYNSGSIEAGDVDGDGREELIVGSGGRWTRDASRQMPSVEILRADTAGTALDTVETLWSGGVELAGEPPALAVADLGAVGRTRHAVGAFAAEHSTTETSAVTRHVECADCHDPHEATSTPAAAPSAYGVLSGAWGVSVDNVSTTTVQYTEQRGVDFEYELCFKCHSGWADLGSSRNLAFEFNPLNPSEHAVEETSTDAGATSGSYVTGWSNDSVMFCVDCHGTSGSVEATGPHASDDAPLLKSPYLGTRTVETALLCYDCHEYDVYYAGSADGLPASTSRFYDQDLVPSRRKLHYYHSATRGYGCSACHVGHGTAEERHLIRDEVAYAHTASGGSCANDCHTGGASRAYARP